MVWFGVGYVVLLAVVLVLNFVLARRNARLYPLVGQGSQPERPVHGDGPLAPVRPLIRSEYVARLTANEEGALYRDFRRTAQLHRDELLVARREIPVVLVQPEAKA